MRFEMRGNRSGGEVARRYFVTIFAVTLLLVLPTTLLIYRTFESVLSRQLEVSALEGLQHVSATFTNLHFSTIPATVQLFEQKEVQRLMYGSRSEGTALLARIELLRQAALSNPLIHSILVYNYRSQTIYASDQGATPIPLFRDRKVLELLENARSYGLYRYIPRRLEHQNVFTLIVGQPPVNGTAVRGAVVVNIDERELRRRFEAVDRRDEGEIIILARDGTILSHPNPALFGDGQGRTSSLMEVLVNREPQGSFRATLDGQELLVTHLRHPVMGWRFVRLTPAERVYGDLHQARNRTLQVIGGVILISVLLTLLTSYHLSAPVRRISRRARELSRLLPGETSREETGVFRTIDETLGRLGSRVHTLEHYYSEHHSLHQEELLRSLMEGTRGEDSVDWKEEGLQALHGDGNRTVVVIRSTQDARAELQQMAQRIQNGLEEPLWRVTISDQMIAVLLMRSALPGDSTDTSVQRVMEALNEPIFEGIDAVAGISTDLSGGRALSTLYQEALTATNARFRGDNRKLYFFEETLPAGEPYQLPEEQVQRLLREVRAGHGDRALALLDVILEEVRDYRFEDFRFLAEYLLYESERRLADREETGRRLVAELSRLRSSVQAMDDVAVFRRNLSEVFDMYITSEASARSTKRRETVEAILATVQRDYLDSNLSPKSIADELSLSTNYVRRLFKTEFGVSIADYITDLRMEECKRRLLSESIPIKELYAAVGFSSYNYFFETFKKHTGMTPTAFRKAYGEAENLSPP